MDCKIVTFLCILILFILGATVDKNSIKQSIITSNKVDTKFDNCGDCNLKLNTLHGVIIKLNIRIANQRSIIDRLTNRIDILSDHMDHKHNEFNKNSRTHNSTTEIETNIKN